TGVMHRNFRIQICLASTYSLVSQLARLVMIYYQLWDVPLEPDRLMYTCDLIKVTVLGYYCSLMGSFAVERYVATHYWKWYEKGSTSTLLVLIAAELVMIIPNFVEAVLNLDGIVSIESNFCLLAMVFTLSFMAFLRMYYVNVSLNRDLSMGAQLGSYSVSRTFQVRENVVVMKVSRCMHNFNISSNFQYMFDLMALPSPFALAAFIAFYIKMFGPTKWQFTRDLAYALYDLFIALTIYREFKRIGLIRVFMIIKISVMEQQPHFIKLNSTSFIAAPFLFWTITFTE
ncbi:hypothetical protein PENTCL1PPCAC_17315, partial [Pristionchus entomophagus]